MSLPAGPKYVLKSFPQGYCMYDHNKGPATNPRHDPYLYGSRFVNRFRSINEFVPHAFWLMQDETLTRSNCECKYCAKKPQREISDTLGLSAKRATSRLSTPGPSQVQRHREPRVRQQKPYTAVRRAPKPVKPLQGPQQSIVPERDADVRAMYTGSSSRIPRWFRKGELVWCALSPPIPGKTGEVDSIYFWPGLVEDVNIKTEAVPRTPGLHGFQDADVDMTGLYEHDSDNIAESGPSSISAANVTPYASHVNCTQDARTPWTVRQWNVYTMKLLAVTHSYVVSDEQVLPYLAYAPSDELIQSMQGELLELMHEIPIKEMDTNLQRIFPFNPCSPEGSNNSGFKQAIEPYTLAIQIASSLARFWMPTDDWDCKFTIPAAQPRSAPPPTTSEPAEAPAPPASLHTLITQSLTHNAAVDAAARSQAQALSSPPVYGSSGLSPDQLHAVETRMLGQTPHPSPIAQVVTQVRYQGLWWGTERIWTDELVRLKLARCQFAPHGMDVVYAPAGPSPLTMQYVAESGHATDVNPHALGAGEKGLFMRIEGLFVVDVPKADGSGTAKECRASGTLFELADEDWEEGNMGGNVEKANDGSSDKGKGKKRAHDSDVANSTSTRVRQPDLAGIDSRLNGPSISQGAGGPSFMPGPSPLKPALPNPDPSVPVSAIAEATLSQTLSPGKSKKRSLNAQLSHPVLFTPHVLLPAPKGFKFRPILPPGHEVVLSLSLISGRYYPHLFQHPLMVPTVKRALEVPLEHGGLYEHRHLWAMEGLLPGVHQSMDPTYWKPSRSVMLKEADADARKHFTELWEDCKREREQPQVATQDVIPQETHEDRLPRQIMDVDTQW
ncbi:hypothetical protein AcV5_009324 [Taiwanofungus camphoratus]|nr:hypothetical protein AcV5_009324 [Antrodia cinnamomea]